MATISTPVESHQWLQSALQWNLTSGYNRYSSGISPVATIGIPVAIRPNNNPSQQTTIRPNQSVPTTFRPNQQQSVPTTFRPNQQQSVPTNNNPSQTNSNPSQRYSSVILGRSAINQPTANSPFLYCQFFFLYAICVFFLPFVFFSRCQSFCFPLTCPSAICQMPTC